MKSILITFIAGVFIIALGYGYIMNIVKLIGCDFKPNYKCEVVHTVGLLTGLGAITGYITINEEKEGK